MKDERGKYYYPFPQNKRVHMYVEETNGMVHFRLWNADDPKLWEEHGWVPHEAIVQAAEMFEKRPEKKSNFDPNSAYNLEIAKTVLKE